MTPNVDVVAGRLDVVSTGSLFLLQGEATTFYFDRPIGKFCVEVAFITDKDQDDQGIEIENVSESHVRVTAKNLNSQLYTATTKPLYIANHGLRKVFLHLSSVLIGAGEKSIRLMHYQLALGETL